MMVMMKTCNHLTIPDLLFLFFSTSKALLIFFVCNTKQDKFLQNASTDCTVKYITFLFNYMNSYGHRLKNTRHPVRSAISKLQIARLVLEWVTIWESLVL